MKEESVDFFFPVEMLKKYSHWEKILKKKVLINGF